MSEYVWYNDLSKVFLEKDYLLPGQSLDDRVDIICNTAEKILGVSSFAQQFKENIKKGWYSLSTPIWTNFGNDRGLPISCYGSYIEDDMAEILNTASEVGMMTKYGGGTSAYFGELRGRGEKIRHNGESSGSVHFMQIFDTLIKIVSQGSTRRGNFAAYLPIDHKDIDEFLAIRSEGCPIQDLSFGVCVPDYWLNEMIDGDKKKRKTWAQVLASRINTGYPYIIFIDNVNNNAPQIYKDKGIKIHGSNLCSEIALASSINESFVCDLSSMNMVHYDDWKNTNAVYLLTWFLDAVMTEFIEKAKKIKFFEKAVNFSERQRALGIGWIGYHSYLQRNFIPFESMEAHYKNVEIAKHIQNESLKATEDLAKEYGEPALLIGTGRRNVTTCAIAPTKSSAFIMGQVSEGIEPHRSNYYIKDLAKGKFTIKNLYLQNILTEKKKNTKKVWDSILKNYGSVQHLDFLDDHEKKVFKTFAEISPKEVIIQAAQRQKYIDQSQSLNLMIHPNTTAKQLNELILGAWELGVKSLYYQYSMNASQNFNRDMLACASCES